MPFKESTFSENVTEKTSTVETEIFPQIGPYEPDTSVNSLEDLHRKREKLLLEAFRTVHKNLLDNTLVKLYMANPLDLQESAKPKESFEVFSQKIKEQAISAFVKILDYDQFVNHQVSLIASIHSVFDIEPKPLRFEDSDQISTSCQRIYNLIYNFRDVQQFEWFCDEVSKEYSSFLNASHSLKPEHFATTAFFVSMNFADISWNVDTMTHVRDAGRNIIAAIMEKRKTDMLSFDSQADPEMQTLMRGVIGLCKHELYAASESGTAKLFTFLDIISSCIKEGATDMSSKNIDDLMDAFASFSATRPLLAMSEQAFKKMCQDFLADDRGFVADMTLKQTRRMISQERGMGLGDSFIYSYQLHRNPTDFGDLHLALKESPFSNEFTYNKNRETAILLEKYLGFGFREMIHEQNPFARKFIEALIVFAESGDTSGYYKIKDKIRFITLYSEDLDVETFLSKAKYEKEIPDPERETGDIRLIDALKRLRDSLDLEDPLPPETRIPELNEAVGAELEKIEFGSGQTELNKDQVINLIKVFNSFINKYFQGNEEMVDIDAVFFASWLERQAYKMIQSIQSFEDQQRIYKEEWFQDILRFYFSIYSAKEYDGAELDSFLKNIQETPSRNYREAYQKIGKRVIQTISDLSKEYTNRGRVYVDSLWGGGLAYQFISLIDERDPLTEYERKFIQEKKLGRATGLANDALHHAGD